MFEHNTVSGAYSTYEQAAETVRALEAAGFNHHHLALVTNEPGLHNRLGLDVAEHTVDLDREEMSEGKKALAVGVLSGGAGGLLAGLGALAVPGVGIIVMGGWLATTLMGASFGGAFGLMSGLISTGSLDRHTERYAEAVHNGATLVVVRCHDSELVKAEAILAERAIAQLPLEEAV